MKKNMYSLMLSENVISAVDELAYTSGSSRSGMVNRILAEYVSYRTPEMRMNELFGMMEKALEPASGLKVMLRSSDTMFSVRSAISYKYNPTVHYCIELYRTADDAIGEMRASLRTQSSSLRLYITQFYKLWSSMERAGRGGECSFESEKFTKKLKPASAAGEWNEINEEALSDALVDYVRAFDGALKAFFYNLNDVAEAVGQVRAYHNDYINNAGITL